MITSHFCAGTGAVLVASRDERAVLIDEQETGESAAA